MTDQEYDELFRTAYPRLVAMGLAMSAPRTVAQDLAQETMLRAYRRRDDLATYDAPLAWCRRVMGNLLIDHHRSRTAEAAALDQLESRARAGGSPSVDPANVVASMRWSDLTSSLTAQQRVAATLYYAEDHSVADIAEVMDVATGTVKSALAKARTNLRRHLGGPDGRVEEAWR